MFEYIRHSLVQLVIIFFLGNIVLLLVPKTLRKSLLGTFRLATWILKFVSNLLSKVGKVMVANAKEIELFSNKTKKPNTTKNPKSNGKVIQFPKAK